MKISIITVVWNNKDTIENAIESVLGQSYEEIEYIIIDGQSTDGTMEIVQRYGKQIDKVVSEKDEGLWDAMNKGLALATGEYVGFLNADDFLAHQDVIARMAKALQNSKADAIYGYLDIVDEKDTTKLVRRYRVKWLTRFALRLGLMPAHPTFYCKRSLFEKYGGFLQQADITPDFELMVRFSQTPGFRSVCLPEVLVKMRNGGLGNSSLAYRFARLKKQANSCKINGIYSAPWMVLLKYPYKLLEYTKIL
ncbi:MAG: glycosyltransferase family 2 protein [Campylobacterota bacterium]